MYTEIISTSYLTLAPGGETDSHTRSSDYREHRVFDSQS